MERRDVESWFRDNPPPSRVDVAELLDRCQSAVCRHAREDAWLAAKQYALDRARTWKQEWSPPASEHFVTNEVCHELAWELAHHEPRVEDAAAEHLVGGSVKEALSEEAWQMLRSWVIELAAAEEHAAWSEIVRYTDHRAKHIIRSQGFTRNSGWDKDHRYSSIAAHVAEILAQEFSLHAHPR